MWKRFGRELSVRAQARERGPGGVPTGRILVIISVGGRPRGRTWSLAGTRLGHGNAPDSEAGSVPQRSHQQKRRKDSSPSYSSNSSSPARDSCGTCGALIFTCPIAEHTVESFSFVPLRVGSEVAQSALERRQLRCGSARGWSRPAAGRGGRNHREETSMRGRAMNQPITPPRPVSMPAQEPMLRLPRGECARVGEAIVTIELYRRRGGAARSGEARGDKLQASAGQGERRRRFRQSRQELVDGVPASPKSGTIRAEQ